jgi:hypothetical protein
MTDENTTETKTEKPEDTTARGERGEVGKATAAQTLKQMWHATHFKHVDANDRHNPRKKVWVPLANALSLKQFARKLVASGDPIAKEWFEHKKGSENQARSDKNAARISLERTASKAARRKKGTGKQAKAAKDAAPAATP